jgi:hypothetical protein
VITEYLAILKPLKTATKRLEGWPEDGKPTPALQFLLMLIGYREIRGDLGGPSNYGVASEAFGRVKDTTRTR